MIKCENCGNAVPNGSYCIRCGERLNRTDYQRYVEMSTYIKNKMRNEENGAVYRYCFEMARLLYPGKVCTKSCSDDDVNNIISMTDDLYGLTIKYKKSAKAATDAD